MTTTWNDNYNTAFIKTLKNPTYLRYQYISYVNEQPTKQILNIPICDLNYESFFLPFAGEPDMYRFSQSKLKSFETCLDSLPTSSPVKSANISVAAVEDFPGEVLLPDACSLGSIVTNLSSVVLTANGSEIPVHKWMICFQIETTSS